MVITGAGPGIMAAGHEGAGAEHSFGANIRLPALNPANVYIANDGKLINFKYFFTRKVTFLKESSAFVLLPGGLGTLDEAFELLTLMQTGKSDIHPIVLLEPEGSTYWQDWLDFVLHEILERNFLLPSDLSLYRSSMTPERGGRGNRALLPQLPVGPLRRRPADPAHEAGPGRGDARPAATRSSPTCWCRASSR